MPTWHHMFIALSLLLVITLSGCESVDPPSEEVGVTIHTNPYTAEPDIVQVSPGQQIAISVEATGVNLQFRWETSKGTLSTSEGPATIYTVPDEPGADTVSVTVTTDNGSPTTKTKHITIVDSPTETERLAYDKGHGPLPLLSSAEEVITKVRERGYIVVGVRWDAPPFGSDTNFPERYPEFVPETDYCLRYDDFKPKGFDINLVREFAQRWLGDSNAVRFVPAPAMQRIDCLKNQRADFFAAAFSDDKCGDDRIECSQVYLQDLADFLIRTNSNFKLNNFCDISGKKISVLEGTTAEPTIKHEFAGACSNLSPPLFSEYTNRDEAIQAVRDKIADMYVTDRLILEQYTGEGLEIAGIGFGNYNLDMAVPTGHQGLLRLINQTLQAMKYDGTYDALYTKSKEDGLGFGCVTPYNLETSISEDDLPPYVKRDNIETATPSCSDLALPLTESVEITIEQGDTLYEIAGKHYGNSDDAHVSCIQNKNPQTIINIHKIKEGDKITLPSSAQCEEYIKSLPSP